MLRLRQTVSRRMMVAIVAVIAPRDGSATGQYDVSGRCRACPSIFGIQSVRSSMTRVAWLTDLHLNFVAPREVDRFLMRVEAERPDWVLIGGDIGEAHDVARYLRRIKSRVSCQIAFVLGNHDFYRGSIARVRAEMAELCRETPRLVYLSDADVVELDANLGLVGHDGWADARVGDYERSDVMLNDYLLIEELAFASKRDRRVLLEQLGDEAAAHIRRVLPMALERYEQVMLLTHVPPLREACWHQGAISDDEWSPHFTCLAVGNAILEIMRQWPSRQLTVLCGHTHSPGECRPLDNVVILTGEARYGAPAIQRIWE
jgi:Icc protein